MQRKQTQEKKEALRNHITHQDNMMNNGERVIAYVINTTRYDIGIPAGWLNANIAIGLNHP